MAASERSRGDGSARDNRMNCYERGAECIFIARILQEDCMPIAMAVLRPFSEEFQAGSSSKILLPRLAAGTVIR
jgi:hypothetical protein